MRRKRAENTARFCVRQMLYATHMDRRPGAKLQLQTTGPLRLAARMTPPLRLSVSCCCCCSCFVMSASIPLQRLTNQQPWLKPSSLCTSRPLLGASRALQNGLGPALIGGVHTSRLDGAPKVRPPYLLTQLRQNFDVRKVFSTLMARALNATLSEARQMLAAASGTRMHLCSRSAACRCCWPELGQTAVVLSTVLVKLGTRQTPCPKDPKTVLRPVCTSTTQERHLAKRPPSPPPTT